MKIPKKEDQPLASKEGKTEVDVDEKKKDKKKKDKKDKKEKESRKSKQQLGPVHLTANNRPQRIDMIGDLDPSVFEEVCLVYCTNVASVGKITFD